MKSFLAAVIAVLAVFSTATAQTGGPTIEFKQKIHDFGKVAQQNDPLKHTFTFKNTGKEPLEIKNVQTSCGCTAPTWSKEKIEPGAEGKIDIIYTKSNIVGPINKSIRVYTNEKDVVKEEGKDVEKDGKVHVLFIKGDVTPKPATGSN